MDSGMSGTYAYTYDEHDPLPIILTKQQRRGYQMGATPPLPSSGLLIPVVGIAAGLAVDQLQEQHRLAQQQQQQRQQQQHESRVRSASPSRSRHVSRTRSSSRESIDSLDDNHSSAPSQSQPQPQHQSHQQRRGTESARSSRPPSQVFTHQQLQQQHPHQPTPANWSWTPVDILPGPPYLLGSTNQLHMATTEMRLNSQRRIIQPAGTLDDPEFDESHSHHQSQQHGGHHGESHHTETHSSIGRALLDSTVRLFGNRAPKLSINVHTAPIVFRGSAEHASGAVLSGQLVIRLHEPLKVRAIRLTLTSREKSSYVVILQAGVPTVREESRTAFEYEWMLPLSTQSRSHTPRHGATVTGGGGGGSNNSPAMTPITASASATGASYFDQQHHHQHHHHHHNPDAIDVLHSIGSAGQSPRIGRAHTSSQTPGGAITPGGTNSSSNNNIGGGGSGGGSNSAVLAAGVHVFDFSVGLPGSLPETTHTPFGSSTHELRAIIERSGFRPNLTCSRFIQVTRRQLTYEHYDSVPILVDGEFDEAKAAYQVFLPRRLVTAGETIEVQVTIDNKSKKNYVDYISAMISEQVEVKSVEGVSLRQLTRPISRTKITNTTAVDYEKGGGRFNSTRTTTAESTAATTITTSSSSGNNNGNNNNSSSGGNGKMTLEKVLQSAAQSGDEIKLFVRIKVPQLYDGIQPDATDGLMRVRHRLTIALKALDEDRRPQSVIIKLPLSIEARLQPYGSHHPDDPLLQGLENMNLSNEYNDEMDFLPVYTPYDVSSAVSPADTPPEYADVPTSPPPPPPYSELQQDHLGRTSTTTSSSS